MGLGTIINAGAIIVGSLIGLLLKHNLKDKYKNVMIQGVGLFTLVLGAFGAIKGLLAVNNNSIAIIVIIFIIIGGVIGAFLNIESNLNRFGAFVQNKFAQNNPSGQASGFVTASIIFCVGAMAIVGSINDGLRGDYSLLAIKAILDGITSMILSSKLGIGVMFAAIPVFIYQGLITLGAHFLSGVLTEQTVINQISIIGNILIVGIGLELLEIKKLKIADMLPAIFLPIIYYFILILF